MAKKRFGTNSAYYTAQKAVTESNRQRKQAKHKKKHPNDVTRHKNPQIPQKERMLKK